MTIGNGSSPLRTLILCGGKGTRAYPHTMSIPKPLMEVAGRPVLERVMDIYAAEGFTDFVLAAGYKIEAVLDFANSLPSSWRVEVADTGEDTNTGERVARCWDLMGDTFFLTYADGLGNVDLRELLAFHRGTGGLLTLTTVPLPVQYGTIQLDGGGQVERFIEKPILKEHWINAGFMVVNRRAMQHWVGEDLEKEILPAIAAAGELFAYRHEGFWKSMDTYKDAVELSALCSDGREPWMHFEARAHS